MRCHEEGRFPWPPFSSTTPFFLQPHSSIPAFTFPSHSQQHLGAGIITLVSPHHTFHPQNGGRDPLLALPALSIDRTDNVLCHFFVLRDRRRPRRLRPGWVLRGQPEQSDHVQQTVRGYHVCIRELHPVYVCCVRLSTVYILHTAVCV